MVGKLCDAAFIWVIDDIRQEIAAAAADLFYYHTERSAAFYMCKAGARMRLVMDIHQSGLILLSLQLMCGEHDDVIRWPYRLKTRLSVIHQSGGRDVSLIIDPTTDYDLSCWSKPTSEMNEETDYYVGPHHTELAPCIHQGAVFITVNIVK